MTSNEVISDQEPESFIIHTPDEPDIVLVATGEPGPQGVPGPPGADSTVPGPPGPQGPTGSIGDVDAVAPIQYDRVNNRISIDANAFDSLGAAAAALAAAQGYADAHIAASKTARAFTYTQTSSSSMWTINHNLNTRPNVTIVDSANQEVFGDITYSDSNTLNISFKSAFSGTAYLI